MEVVLASKEWCKPYTKPLVKNISEFLTEQVKIYFINLKIALVGLDGFKPLLFE